MTPHPGRGTLIVFGATLALFATTATAFEARVTDISALRVLDGEVPYRDFWTMYAPGSFTLLALAFGVTGRELIVSNLLGIVTSAAAVALYYRLAAPLCGRVAAAWLAALVAAAFYGTGYHDGFTSYPPALLLILAAVHLAAARCSRPGAAWAMVPGLLLSAAALFKHDVAAYATLALGTAIAVVRTRIASPRWAPPIVLGAAAAVLPVAAASVLVLLGAGPDAWRDLVVFPLTDFSHVRPEYIPIVPRLHASVTATARELTLWGVANLPLAALAAGAWGLRRRWSELAPGPRLVVAVAVISVGFHWTAAHVQMNTHAISLAAWSALVAAAGGRVSMPDTAPSARRPLLAIGLAVWGLLLIAEPVYLAAARGVRATEWVGLPHLRGIRASHEQAGWMRALASAIAEAGDPRAPLLMLGHRNDIHVFAESTPYWLTARRPVTRHHELHPGITDTAPVQREMLEQMAHGPAPIVIREYRFPDEVLDSVKADLLQAVPIGSTLIDEWIARRYGGGQRFGPYELLRPG